MQAHLEHCVLLVQVMEGSGADILRCSCTSLQTPRGGAPDSCPINPSQLHLLSLPPPPLPDVASMLLTLKVTLKAQACASILLTGSI
jgi:hypothetical protein